MSLRYVFAASRRRVPERQSLSGRLGKDWQMGCFRMRSQPAPRRKNKDRRPSALRITHSHETLPHLPFLRRAPLRNAQVLSRLGLSDAPRSRIQHGGIPEILSQFGRYVLRFRQTAVHAGRILSNNFSRRLRYEKVSVFLERRKKRIRTFRKRFGNTLPPNRRN